MSARSEVSQRSLELALRSFLLYNEGVNGSANSLAIKHRVIYP